MLINPVERFYTKEDRINLAHLRSQADKLLGEIHTVRGELNGPNVGGNVQLVESLTARLTTLWDERWDIDNAQNNVLNAIEARYAASFNGNTAGILDDVRAIVDATEKEEYLAYQKTRTAEFKPLLENPPKDRKSPEYTLYKRTKALSVRGYQNCYLFILNRINAQLKALAYYGAGDEEALAIVEAKAASCYNKPKAAKIPRGPIERELPLIKKSEVRGDLLTLPSGQVTALLLDILGGDLGQIADRKTKYNRHGQLLVQENGDKRKVSYTAGQNTVTLQVDDFQKITGTNVQTKKLLIRILIRANEQAIHNGELTRNFVEFPLREMVGRGQYKNLDTARQGFFSGMDVITSLKASGKVTKGKNVLQSGKLEVLYTGADVTNATCIVYLNERINWGVIAPFFTLLPDYYFELPGRAADLLEYIFYLARQKQNLRKIAEQGYFTIGYRAIQNKLNLPNEDTIRNTKRDIKDAIESAIEAIEERYAHYAPPLLEGEEPSFSLLPLGDYDAPIKEYLDDGRLKVSLKGDYAQRFIEISERTAAKLEAARKRQERIEDRARSINLAKSQEAEKKP